MHTRDIYRVHEELFSAAAGETPFANALELIVGTLGGSGGVVFELNRRTGAIANWVGPGLESGESDYINHLNAINPRMHYSLRHTAGHIIYDGKFIDERGMDRHEFYDAIHRNSGVRYFVGSRVYDEGDVSLFHSVEFTSRHGHPDQDKIESFRRIAPAIGNAWRLSRRSARNANRNGSNPWTPDHLPWSIFALSSTGTIVDMNIAGQEMLDRSDVVCLQDGVLKALDRSSSAGLEIAMQRAIAGKTSETLLSSEDGNAALIAQIVPVNPAEVSAPQNISMLIYIWNPLHRTGDIGQVLARLYGFTAAESGLAAKLASGADLNLAADQLGISRNTARNQLQKIFAKSGTHRQSEFLVRIMGILEH
jgi:DNA-binding CsgD family transcriptional regulator